MKYTAIRQVRKRPWAKDEPFEWKPNQRDEKEIEVMELALASGRVFESDTAWDRWVTAQIGMRSDGSKE